MRKLIVFQGSSSVAAGNSGIIVYNLTTTSGADSGAPDSFASVPFNLAVTFTDIIATSSKLPSAVSSAPVNFSGLFKADTVTKSSLLPGPVTWTSPTEASLLLGSDDTGWRVYTIDIASFTPPGQPGGAPGSMQAIVRVVPSTPGGPGEPPPDAPEPTSLLLAGLALPALFIARRRKKAE